MEDFDNILNTDGDINEELLIKYLEGKLSKEEAHAVEQHMANSDFVNDAVEGLEQIKSKKNIPILLNELNKDLQKQTQKPKNKRAKRKLKDIDGMLITVVIVLMLCILGYAVLHVYEQNKKQKTEVKK